MKTLIYLIILIVIFSCSNSTDDEKAGEKSLNSGNSSFSGKDYQTAYNQFLQSLSESKDSEITFKATVGIAFTSLRLKNYDDANNYFTDAWKLDSTNLDVKAGLSLLSYSYDKEYSKVLSLSEDFLNQKTYVFYLDGTLNANDVILLRALSQFELKDFTACFTTISIDLDKTLDFQSGDTELVKKLLKKLEELIVEYSN
jgi:tetratricopeptide (TPR) repeat protein